MLIYRTSENGGVVETAREGYKGINFVSLYKKSLAQEEGYGACFSREGSAEVKSENRS